MSNTIVFSPDLPPAVLFGFAGLALLFAGYFILRSPIAGLLRALALAALFALLANPLVQEGEETPLADIAVILTDTSASQGLGTRNEDTARLAEDLKTKLEGTDGIEVIEETVGTEETSDIGDGLSRLLGDLPRGRLGAVFVVTDGQSTDDLNVSGIGNDIPVHTVLTGRSGERDRKLSLVEAPRYGLLNEPVTVSFRIDDVTLGDTPIETGEPATVSLRVNGTEVLRDTVPVGAEIQFPAPLDRPGNTIIELEVSSLEGELTDRNNLAILPISVIRDRLRVLLISGEPHPGERAWRNLLKSDPAIDLVHFTILRPIEKAQSDNALERELALIEFPQDELFIEKLAEFDLIVFDRYTYRGVMNAFHFDNISRFVENGGAVLVSSGPEFVGPFSLSARRNFGYILPVEPGASVDARAYRPEITEVGERHPVTRGLPEEDIWGRWLRIVPVRKRSGTTLMTGPDDQPLLVLDRVGKGRAGVLASDHVWLWARGFDGGGPHTELLRRVAHWLMKEPDLEENQLQLQGTDDTLTITYSTLDGSRLPVALTLPDGTSQIIEMREPIQPTGPGESSESTADDTPEDVSSFESASRTTLKDMPPGLYRARAGELFAVGTVGLGTSTELRDVVATPSLFEPLAEKTGAGLFQPLTDGNASPAIRRIDAGRTRRSGDRWAGVLERKAKRVQNLTSRPFLPEWVWLALIGFLLIGAWLVESRRI
ncbi:MAG: hypothetical protein AAFR03_13735 [Pseudomonadota bacterium]